MKKSKHNYHLLPYVYIAWGIGMAILTIYLL
jgi:hypothetical protein